MHAQAHTGSQAALPAYLPPRGAAEVVEVAYEGILLKRSEWLQEWRRRHVVLLRNGQMLFSKSAKDVPHSFIDLNQDALVESPEDANSLGLLIKTTTKSLMLCADSTESKSELISAIARTVTACRFHLYVQPTSPQALAFATDLRGLDMPYLAFPETSYAYAFQGHIDFDALRVGLSRTMNRIPALACRLIDGPRGLHLTNANSSGGVLEFHRDLTHSMPLGDAPCLDWVRFFPANIPLIPEEPFDRPLLQARLTHCHDGSVLAIMLSHVVADGESITKFNNIWSEETAAGAAALASAATNIAVALCTRNVPQDLMEQKLNELVPSEERQKEPMLSMVQLIELAGKFLIAKVSDEVVDIVFTQQQWDEVKKSVSRGMKEGQWVSSYEALMTTLLQCMARADGLEEAKAVVVVNLRGRSLLVPKDYFGNGLGMHFFSVPTHAALADAALLMHESLRQGIKDPTQMEKPIVLADVFAPQRTRGKFTGLIRRTRSVPAYKQCLIDGTITMNSWVGYSWFDVSFGLPDKAMFMRLAPDFRARNLLHVFPRSHAEYQCRVQLPKDRMSRFLSQLSDSVCEGFKWSKM